MQVQLTALCATGRLPRHCSCWKVDKMLVSALISMERLEVLSIQCYLCRDPPNPLHRYLMELPTRSMREFCYDCQCTTKGCAEPTPFVLAPWMASITALKWTPWVLTPTLAKIFSELIQDVTFLPNIDTLHYNNMGRWDELLAKRAIRRISCINCDPVPAIRRVPDKHHLTHFSIPLQYLRELLDGSEINKFRNLQHVGTLNTWSNYFDPDETKVSTCDYF